MLLTPQLMYIWCVKLIGTADEVVAPTVKCLGWTNLDYALNLGSGERRLQWPTTLQSESQ